MRSGNNSDKISRVYRSREEVKKSYDKMSRFYDCFAGIFERKYSNTVLRQLDIEKGELVLEVGFGTGFCLNRILKAVGKTGKVCGIDISSGMLEVARKRLGRSGLLDRVELTCGDAIKMPYNDNIFDAVFMSFTLELFDTPEIPIVLNEIKRVLKPRGRLGIASISKEGTESKLIKLYEWAHRKYPVYIDCRPIYVERSVRDAFFEIKYKDKVQIFGLPVEMVICIPPFPLVHK